MTTATLTLITIISLAISFFCFLALVLKPVTQEQIIGITFIFFSLVSGFGYYTILRAGLNINCMILATKLKYYGSMSFIVQYLLIYRYVYKKVGMIKDILP
ncbi:MAG: hypothetical protein K6F69_00955 [Treponema sp.]|nr:hypothetical protein [Treponema sp.]